MIKVFAPSPKTTLLKTLPGVGELLAMVIWSEIGSIKRFSWAEQLASYCGLLARQNSSGENPFWSVRRDVNVFEVAFVEVANNSVLNARRCGPTGFTKGLKHTEVTAKRRSLSHATLSEATFWMLKKGKP